MIDSALRFLLECEKLKGIERRSRPLGLQRRENSAEHSWSLALMAMTLAPAVDPTLETLRILKMLIIHDLVEIDAGDTFCYADQTGKAEREQAAADRIFGLLPQDAAAEFRGLWDEFEARETAEARFANAMDRLAPILLNHANSGGAWKEHELTATQVLERNAIIGDVCPALGKHVERMVADAVSRDWLKSGA